MAETKLTNAKVPNMKPAPKKLGLLTPKKRKDISFRFRNKTIERLNEMLAESHEKIHHKVSRTDIIEALVIWAAERPIQELQEKLSVLGKD